jgi:transposase-like protein
MYSLEDVFIQAIEDDSCGGLDGVGYQARISLGVKIIKDNETNEVQLFNTSYGEHYREVSNNEYEVFKEKGWEHGIYYVSLSNSRRKLDLIERKIRIEMNGKCNAKQIQKLKNNRQRNIEKYSEISNKLNELNNG